MDGWGGESLRGWGGSLASCSGVALGIESGICRMEILLNYGTWAERDCDCASVTWLGQPLGSDMLCHGPGL